MTRELPVLYICGLGRSGSTIVARCLNEIDGFRFVGETRRLWVEGVGEDRLCGCGEPFSRCPFWVETTSRVRETLGGVELSEAVRQLERAARTRQLPALLIPILRARLLARSVESLRLLEGLYDSMRQVAGARVLVDASKSPAYALLLSNVPGIDLRVLHLVRDPRGAVFSWANPKFNPASGRPLVRLSGPRMVALWNTWNLGAELLGRSLPGPHRYARLRYEDFAEAPAAQLHRALRTLAMPGTGALPPFAGERRIFLTRGHTIGGNPGRFEEGVIEIRRDERWRDEASAAFRALVALGCAPLLKRYGYRFRRPPRADRGPSASAPGQIS